MSRFSPRRSVWQEESFISFVYTSSHVSGTTSFSHESVLSPLFSNDPANSQHNTVVQGKYIAATSWLCVLLDNTTIDNVYIHLDIKLTCSQGWLSDWTGTMSYEQNEMFFFSWKWLLCIPVSHWIKFDDSVLDSAYDWLALSPLHHSDN